MSEVKKQDKDCIERFMKRRELKTPMELIEYILRLEEIEYDHTRLKNKIANLYEWSGKIC